MDMLSCCAMCIVLVRDTKDKASHHGYVPTDDRWTSLIILTMVVVLVIAVLRIGIQKLWTNGGELCVSERVRKYAQIHDFVNK